jgi:1-acyl-sn-glycerol-3-phosphate acyltransferase
MLRLRTAAFNIGFYAIFIGYMLLFPILALLPMEAGLAAAHSMVRNQLRLSRLFGLKLEIRGREHLPKGGALIAAKHQSMWETLALLALFDKPAFVYKQELGRIPLFSYYLRKFRMIPVDRKGGRAALRQVARDGRAAIDAGHQVIIFPEGTRQEPGAPPDYKFGVAMTYAEIDRPVIPIALNSGLYWSDYAWRGHTGTVVVEILPPIPPGLPPRAFFAELERVIEARSDALLLETAQRPDAPPLGEAAAQRVAALQAAPAAVS